MRCAILVSFTAISLIAAPAYAQEEPDKPITDTSVSAEDVATTPVTDLNLKKEEIPQLLLAAQERPYALAGNGRCAQIAAAITELDAVLGPDLDVADEDEKGITAGRVAKSVVSSFIPFRGIIREISGANAQERKLQAAIMAGMARRAFLKGYGQARGCRAPARASATSLASTTNAPPATTPAKGESVQFVSQPVVQRVN